jgi:tripartite-type tricarboxylate transporter receptor subunit TctC
MHRSGPERGALFVCAAALAFALCAPGAFAQTADWPARPIRFVVPLPPGGGADLVARTLGEKLNRGLGQQVIIDNRPGGGTVIGAELVAHAVPDGYTMLLGTATTHAINASLVKNLPYDPVRDFSPVALVAILPLILVANSALPADTLPELIALARKRPGEILFGSTGNGSSIHLAGEMLNTVAKINMVHVPYKGAAPALTDLLAGQIQFMFTTIPPALPYLKTGRLKALTVANAKRSPLLPEVPTTAEGGAPGVEASSWNGVLFPHGTAQEIVTRLARELATIMNQADVRERLSTAGVESLISTPAEFTAFMAAETARYARVVKTSGARVD